MKMMIRPALTAMALMAVPALMSAQEVTRTVMPDGTVVYTQEGQTYSAPVGTYRYGGTTTTTPQTSQQRYYPSTRSPDYRTTDQRRYSAPRTEASAENATYSGPAYQYEGKWMAQVQSGPTGAVTETLATCANPIVITASSPTTLQIRGGGQVQITPIDTQTFAWTENGQSRMVTESTKGNFIALASVPQVYGRYEGGQQIINYMRCGTAGATAADQLCIAE